jgi:hypothetical protein
MGFDKLYRELSAVDHPVLARLLAMPALVSCMRSNYDDAGSLYRPFVKARIRSVIARLQKGETIEGEALIHTLAKELAERMSLYAHAADVEVKRWARISAELRADPEAFAFLCSFCDAKLVPLVKPVFSWMVSECNRRGCPMRALSA